jgi:hypothetical protein
MSREKLDSEFPKAGRNDYETTFTEVSLAAGHIHFKKHLPLERVAPTGEREAFFV